MNEDIEIGLKLSKKSRQIQYKGGDRDSPPGMVLGFVNVSMFDWMV